MCVCVGQGKRQNEVAEECKKNAVRRGIVKTLTLVVLCGGERSRKIYMGWPLVRRFFWESLKIKCEVDNFWIFLVMYSVFFGVKEGRLPVKKPRNTEKVPVNIFVI